MKKTLLTGIALFTLLSASAQKEPVDYVNPFIGTTNYGTTKPGAICPQGLMSVTPFNVMGKIEGNAIDKDSQWWSTPYEYNNKYHRLLACEFEWCGLSGSGFFVAHAYHRCTQCRP